MLENLRNTPPINTKIKKPLNILPLSERKIKQAVQPRCSHQNSVHPTKSFTERDTVIRRQLTPYKAQKAKSTSENKSPESSSVSQKTQISNSNHDIPQSIDPFIDLPASSLLQMELE